jgi:hypothetical protein
VKRGKGRAVAGLLAATGVAAVGGAPAQAAAPDGKGPWADAALYSKQGKRADGTAVLPSRSNPKAAVGVAEDTTGDGTFFSLGFGGEIVLGFLNPIVNGTGADMDLQLVEATFEPYPAEVVDVYVLAKRGRSWTWVKVASNVNKDAQLALPTDVKETHVVRLVDVSDKSLFTGPNLNADGYDVDGVKALHTAGGSNESDFDQNSD